MTSIARFPRRLTDADPAAPRDREIAADRPRPSPLAGSRIAIIEPGYDTKRFLYERAAELGVELVLVGDPSSWARGLVGSGVAACFLDVDSSGHPDAAARAILAALGAQAQRLDGVLTFWEDVVPATARVAAALGLPGMPVAAADAARSKLRTLEASRAAGLPTPRFVGLNGAASLGAAAANVGFPAVIKPVYGAEALGCLRVDDFAGLEAGYARVGALITPDLNPIFLQGCDLLLEEYLDGTEFDVDILLSGGACVFAAVSENWPTNEPYFVETGLHTPSAYPPERQAAIVELCVRTALELGFRDGVLHAEAKDTGRGPRILELNARLGGGSIVEYHRLVTGVDLLEQQLLVSTGHPVAPAPHSRPACGIANVFVQASRSGTLAHTRFFDHLADDASVIQHAVYVEAGERVTSAANGFPTVIGEISVRGPSTEEARARAQALVAALEIPYAG